MRLVDMDAVLDVISKNTDGTLQKKLVYEIVKLPESMASESQFVEIKGEKALLFDTQQAPLTREQLLSILAHYHNKGRGKAKTIAMLEKLLAPNIDTEFEQCGLAESIRKELIRSKEDLTIGKHQMLTNLENMLKL